jgi:hypothetical protein
MSHPRYSPKDYGSYYIETGELIGHEAVDVSSWLSAHPEYAGSIEFERWDFEGSVNVRDVFFGEEAEDVELTMERAA